MKVAPVSSILLWLVLSFTAPTFASCQWFDFVGDVFGDWFGNGSEPDDTKTTEKKDKTPSKQQESVSADYVMEELRSNAVLGPVMEQLTDYALGTASTQANVAQGRRAYNCMNQIKDGSDDELSSNGPARKHFRLPDGIMQTISYAIIYQLFDSDADIDMICPNESSDNARLRRVLGASGTKNNRNNNKLRRRRTQEQSFGMGMTPNYPLLDPNDVTTRFFVVKNSHMTSFLESANLNNRTSLIALMDQLNAEIVVYQTTQENLVTASEWVDVFGDFVSTVVPEAGVAVAGVIVDFGSLLRGTAQLLRNIAGLITNNITRRQSAVHKLSNHMALIDSAEIEAGYHNTELLIRELSALKQQVAALQDREE